MRIFLLIFIIDITQLDKELNALQEQQDAEKIEELQTTHKRVMELIKTSNNQDEIVNECAILLLERLFTEQIVFKKINFFLAVLGELKLIHPNLPLFLVQWVFLPKEKRVLKIEIILKLIKHDFLPSSELDSGFVEVLETSNNDVQIYLNITKLVKLLIIDEKMFPATIFQRTIDLIVRSIKAFREIYPKMGKYLEDFKNSLNKCQLNVDSTYRKTLDKALSVFDPKDEEYYNQTFKKLEEWLSITSEKEMPDFSKVLETTIFQAQDDSLVKFFTFMTDICVDNALNSLKRIHSGKPIHTSAMDFSYVDALSKLIIVMLKTIINTDKKGILEPILTSCVLTLTKNHEVHKENFNQRPFFRLFYNIIFVFIIGKSYFNCVRIFKEKSTISVLKRSPSSWGFSPIYLILFSLSDIQVSPLLGYS